MVKSKINWKTVLDLFTFTFLVELLFNEWVEELWFVYTKNEIYCISGLVNLNSNKSNYVYKLCFIVVVSWQRKTLQNNSLNNVVLIAFCCQCLKDWIVKSKVEIMVLIDSWSLYIWLISVKYVYSKSNVSFKRLYVSKRFKCNVELCVANLHTIPRTSCHTHTHTNKQTERERKCV